jgi:hypothetical protein
MNRPRALIASLATVAALGAAGGSPAIRASAATSTDPAGEITLPALYGPDLPKLSQFVGSPAGFAWQFSPFDNSPGLVFYSSYGGAQHVDAGSAGDADFTLAGSQLRLSEPLGETPLTGVPAIDITTGSPIANPRANQGVWGTGSGAIYRENINFGPSAGTYELERTDNTGSVVSTYPGVPIEGTDTGTDQAFVVDADSRGAVVQAWGDRGGESPVPSTLDYLDFTTGDYTVLDDTQYAGNAVATLSADDIVWTHAGHALYIPRDNLTATPAAASPDGGIDYVALSGAEFGYTTTHDAAGVKQSQRTVKTGVLGSTDFTALSNSVPILEPIEPANDGDFVVVAGNALANFGVYRLLPGATELSANLALFGPTAPLGIDASAGRILTVIGNSTSHPVDQTQLRAVAQKVRASRHHATLIKSTAVDADPDPSGGNTAYLERISTGTGARAVVLNGTEVVGSYAVPGSAFRATLSGNLLLVPFYADAATPKGGADLININTGVITPEPESAALYGGTESYLAADGVRQRDLATGADTLIPNSAGCTGDPQTTILQSDGDWVFCDPSQSDGLSIAYNVATGAQVSVPTAAALYDQSEGVNDVILAGGHVAWIDASDRSVHVLDLATQTDDVVGTAHPAVMWHQYLALTDDFAAWVASDDTTRVVPLSASATAAPRYLGAISSSKLTADSKGAAGRFRPQIDTDRPLTRWTMTIRNSRHHIVRTLRGTAPDGGVRPSWNGRSHHGRLEPVGVYHWTLSGRGSTGALVRANGVSKPIGGVVRIVRHHHRR